MKRRKLQIVLVLLAVSILAGCNGFFRTTHKKEVTPIPYKNTEAIATLVASTLTPEMPLSTATGLPGQPTPTATYDSGLLSKQIDAAASDLDKFLEDLNSTDTLKDIK